MPSPAGAIGGGGRPYDLPAAGHRPGNDRPTDNRPGNDDDNDESRGAAAGDRSENDRRNRADKLGALRPGPPAAGEPCHLHVRPRGDAIAVERLRDRPADEIREVQATVGAAVDGIWGPETEGKVRRAAERICPRPDPEPAATATTKRAPRPIRSVAQDVVSLAYSADRGYDADIDARFQTLAEEAGGPLTGAIRRVANAGGDQLMRRCAANQMVFDYNLYLDGRGGNLNEWLATPYLDLDTDIRRRADGALGNPCDDFPWYE